MFVCREYDLRNDNNIKSLFEREGDDRENESGESVKYTSICTPFVHLLPEKMRENLRKNEKIQKMKLILLGFTEYP